MTGTRAISDGDPRDAPDRPPPDRSSDEERAEERQRRLAAAIVESSDDAIVGEDLDGIITSWNPGAERLYGYPAAEIVGRPSALLIPPERPDELPSIMRRLRRGERIEHYETMRIRKDGTRLDVSVGIAPIRDAQGRIVGAASIARDITDRRRSEQERQRLLIRERAAREQLDAILGGVADGVVVQREDGTFVYANDAAARLAGFASAEQYLATGTIALAERLSVLDADGQPFPYDQLPARRAFLGEPAPEMVAQFRRLDTGDVRWSRTQSRIVRGVDGERLAISIFHDITEELRSRDRLRFLAEAGARLAGSLDVEETLEALVRVASTTLADWAVVLLIDEDGAVQHITSAHRDPEKERMARELHRLQLRHASGATLLWQAIQTRQTLLVPDVSDEMLVRTARNEEHLAMLRALGLGSLLYVPLVQRDRVQGALALFMAESRRRFGEEDRSIAIEIARRAALTLENARLYREARDAVRARDAFLSIASHELRTPVTSISGIAQVALRSKERGTLDDARLTRVLEQIMRGSQRLVALTEDLLDVSRLQTGRFGLRPEQLDLRAFVADVVDRFGADLGDRHRLTLDASGASTLVRADPARLEQVLVNVLSNAVKYSPDGGPIVVSVRQDETGSRVTVRDPGIGLPAGAEEAIFEPFGRAPNAAHRQIQGLGLGLYISRQIMERHHGRIWAESPGDGQGTAVHVWLPRATSGQ
jgi:PAS domain S-box-containing protein